MMLVSNGDGTYLGGPLDVICVLQDETTGLFHACFMEEHPMPGPVVPANEVTVVRLKSKMHHTTGAWTFEEGVEQARELAASIHLADENLMLDAPWEWDGAPALVRIIPNWRTGQPA